jgi:hypothetical protein
MGTDAMRETTLTREELYELVWTEPIQTLATRFGISDVALKKRLVKMRVPTPGRGAWAKKAAGGTMRRPALPRLPASVPFATLTAVFRGAPKTTDQEQAAEATGPVADQARYESLPEHQITVPEMLTDPHSLVATTVLLLRRSRTDAQHVLVPSGKKHLAIHVTLGTADRAMLLYDTLIKALEARGFSVKVASGEHGPATTVTIGMERIGLLIDERIDRVERKPDPKVRHPVYGRQYDYSPTGRLSIRLQLPYLGEARVRQNWWDASKQRVESCLNSVVVGLVTAAEALKAQRNEQEARERERVAAEERRVIAEKRRQEEEARIRALGNSLKAWRRSEIPWLRGSGGSMPTPIVWTRPCPHPPYRRTRSRIARHTPTTAPRMRGTPTTWETSGDHSTRSPADAGDSRFGHRVSRPADRGSPHAYPEGASQGRD